jgi:hypothetical protein
MAQIRDAEGLDTYEYLFLMTVESRGVLFTHQLHTLHDMRMGRTKYYEVMEALKGRGLIVVEEIRNQRSGKNRATRIRVDAEAVSRLRKREYDPDTGALVSKSSVRRIRKRSTPSVRGADPLVRITDEVVRTAAHVKLTGKGNSNFKKRLKK